MVSQLSRDHHVSRQSLSRWKQKAEQALQEVFLPKSPPAGGEGELERQVLTLLIEAHASYRQIQVCLKSLLGFSLSLGSIYRIVKLAGEPSQSLAGLPTLGLGAGIGSG